MPVVERLAWKLREILLVDVLLAAPCAKRRNLSVCGFGRVGQMLATDLAAADLFSKVDAT